MERMVGWRRRGAGLSVALGLTVLLLMLSLAAVARPQVVTANGGVTRYVATDGADTGDCADRNNPCATLQYAVDMAAEGDEIHVAAGTYTGVQERGGLRQMVIVTKQLTLRGGYHPTTWEWDVQQNPTTLDAQGLGRALVISGTGTITDRMVMGGFRVTGGRGVSLTLPSGVVAELLAALLPHVDNAPLATTDAPGAGGVYVHESAVTFQHMDFYQNLGGTSMSAPHVGGAAMLYNSDVCFENTTIRNNVANPNYAGSGGGVLAYGSIVHLAYTIVENNMASTSQMSPGYGGGLFAQNSQVMMNNTQFVNNTAGGYNQSLGGGFLGVYSTIEINNSQFTGNTASTEDRGYGGAIYGVQGNYTIQNSVFSNNVATTDADAVGVGGGTYFINTAVTLDSNLIYGNSAGPGENTFGGAVAVEQSATLTDTLTYKVTNNAIISGTANAGGAWYARSLNPDVPINAEMINNTFDNNNALGIIFYDHTHATFVNNIVANTGINMARGTASIAGSHNLYWPQRTVGGPGNINLTDELTGDPWFINPQALNYDIGYDSAAKDAGTNSWLHVVNVDISKRPRPVNGQVDIGANEHSPNLYLPVVLKN